MFLGVLLNQFPGNGFFCGKHIKHGIIYPVQMSFRSWTAARIALRLFQNAYFFFRSNCNKTKPDSLLRKHGKGVLRHSSGNGFRCQIKQFGGQAFPHRLYCRKHGGNGLTNAGRRLHEQFLFSQDAAVYSDNKVLLSRTVFKGKLQIFYAFITLFCPVPLPEQPFGIFLYQAIKPLLQLCFGKGFLKPFYRLCFNIYIGHLDTNLV